MAPIKSLSGNPNIFALVILAFIDCPFSFTLTLFENLMIFFFFWRIICAFCLRSEYFDYSKTLNFIEPSVLAGFLYTSPTGKWNITSLLSS